MATGTSLLSQISDDFLACQICLQPYRRPKLLSCLHTFCQECLELFHTRQEEQRELECPTCRTKTQLPASGVSVLKDNVFVESLRNTLKLYKTVKETAERSTCSNVVCGACESVGKAKSYCVDCGELLCDGCVAVHGRLRSLKGHQLIGVEEVRTGTGLKATRPRTQPCTLHKDESLKFYCETCGEALCRDCIMLEHKDHSYTLLSQASAGIKKELATALQDADKRMAGLKDKQQVILSKKSLLKETVAEVQDEIHKAAEHTRDRMKRLLHQVSAEEKDLLQEVRTIEKQTEKELCTAEDTVDTAIVGLSGTTEFCRSILAHGTDLEITSVRTEVQSRLQSLLQLCPTQLHTPAGEPWVGFVTDGAVKIDDDVTLVGDVIEGDDISAEGFKATFTSLGKCGPHGPTSLGQHYRGQDHDGLVTLQNGIQLFTVKYTGTYVIETAGAAAGDPYDNSKAVRGRGARMQGTFHLKKGELLKILVGQEGTKNCTEGVGGGGGTFVTRQDNTPLIIAGGGGGGAHPSVRKTMSDGTRGTTGNPSSGGKAGGKNGTGAVQGAGKDDPLGGGGGGLLTDGASPYVSARSISRDEGGRAFVHGGAGGMGLREGGFGGGGAGIAEATNYRGGDKVWGGGGGGYSGGGRGDNGKEHCGGGGGSFNSGRDACGQSGANNGPGYVVITMTRKNLKQ